MTTDASINITVNDEPASTLIHQIGYDTSGTIGRVKMFSYAGIFENRPLEDIEYPQVGSERDIVSGIDAYGVIPHALTEGPVIFLDIEPSLGTAALEIIAGFLGATHGPPFEPLADRPVRARNPALGRRDVGLVSEAVLERLEYLARLPQNWDNDGAAPISPATIERARTVLQEAFDAGAQNLPLPSIAPAYDGMLVMEWSLGTDKELTIDIPVAADEPCGFLLVETQSEGGETEIDEELGDEWSVPAVIQRLLGL